MSSDLFAELLQATWLASAAIALAWLLRLPVRRILGARAAYALWMLVPAAVLAGLVPGSEKAAATLAPPVGAVIAASVATLSPAPSPALASAWLVAWAGGALVMLALLMGRQIAFRRQLRPGAAAGYEVADHAGPAVIGLLKPRLVLPSDFERRYTPDEQALVLAHEHLHLSRRDLHAQALCSLLRVLFWFNPLVHLAARRFRFDQELACDADVLARHPGSRRAYGTAMVKTQLADFGLPLGCHWQSCHPLTERLAMLKQPLPGTARRRIGLIFVTALTASSALTAWAAQPVADTDVPRLESVTDADVLTPPPYPKAALDAGISGMVWLKVLVAADGSVSEAQVVKSEPAGVFDAAAMEGVKQWKFSPASRTSTGEPVAGWVMVPVKFAADASAEPAAP